MADTEKKAIKADKKASKKADKTHKKAAKKDYERRHAQLKRQQGFHSTLLAGQAKRAKQQAKKDSAGNT